MNLSAHLADCIPTFHWTSIDRLPPSSKIPLHKDALSLQEGVRFTGVLMLRFKLTDCNATHNNNVPWRTEEFKKPSVRYQTEVGVFHQRTYH